MKIAYFHSSAIPSRTANSIQVVKMCYALAKNGNNVTLLAPNSTNKEIGIKCIYSYYGVNRIFKIKLLPFIAFIGSGLLYHILSYFYVKLLNPDLIYSRSIGILYKFHKLKIPIVYEAHHPPNAMSRQRINKLIKTGYLKNIVVISNELRNIFIREMAGIEEYIIVAHDGAELHDNRQIISNNINIDKSKTSVIYVGHLYQGRGVNIIIELAKRCKWAEFTLVGGNEKEIKYWSSKISGLDNINLLGYIEPSKTHSIRLSADILIAPYQNDVLIGTGVNTAKYMSPLKVFEYMSARKPIVLSDLPVLKEIITHGENGWICDPDNINEWVSALEKLRVDKELSEYIAQNAYDDFKKKYTWDERAKFILDKIIFD